MPGQSMDIKYRNIVWHQVAYHQIRFLATSEMNCQSGDIYRWPLQSSSRFCVGMYRLIYFITPKGLLKEMYILKHIIPAAVTFVTYVNIGIDP